MKTDDTGLLSILKPKGIGHCILKFDSAETCANFETIVNDEKVKCKGRRIKLKPCGTTNLDTRNEMTVERIL